MSYWVSVTVCLMLFSSKQCTIKQLTDSVFNNDILDNQHLNQCYQPQSAENTSHHLDYSGDLITKTSSNKKQ